MLNDFVFGDRALGASGDTHPLWMLGHALADPYVVIGASAIGQIHLARGLPRDDAFVVRSLGPWLAIAVADGVGSRPLSRYGATYVVEALTALLLRPFAIPLSELRANHAAHVVEPQPSNLAPPAIIEDVELKSPFAHPEPEQERQSIPDPDILKELLSINQSASERATPNLPQQSSSVGWWLPTTSAALHASDRTQERAPADISTLSGAKTETERDPTPTSATAASGEPDIEKVMNLAFEKTHVGLRGHAQALGIDLADLSCTALALLLNRETGRYATGQVGDGAILGMTEKGNIQELIHAPDPGDGQSTYTLNHPNFQKYLQVQTMQPAPANRFASFFLMTDGLSGDLLFSSQRDALSNWGMAVKRNLSRASSPAQAAAGMLNWLASYQIKGSWDDRTLVVITTQQESSDGNRHPGSGQSGPAQSPDNQ